MKAAGDGPSWSDGDWPADDAWPDHPGHATVDWDTGYAGDWSHPQPLASPRFDDPGGKFARTAQGVPSGGLGVPSGGLSGSLFGGRPTWLLVLAAVSTVVGVMTAVWPGSAVPRLMLGWFVCGLVVLSLVAAYTWMDVRLQARRHYPSLPGLAWLRGAVLVAAAVGVVVAAVRVADVVARFGWGRLWSW